LADAYLNIAEQVILAEGRPLRPKEIIEHAHIHELMPWHLHGGRQDKTLHARLSEDIARNPERSRFLRTSPGTFYLRLLQQRRDTPSAYQGVYLAPPRRKELKRDAIFSVRLDALVFEPGNTPELVLSEITAMLGRGDYSYRSVGDLSLSQETALVHSFVVIYKAGRVLSFRCGKFSRRADPIYGHRSVGIGGAVLRDDADLLYESMYGIVENGISELCYGIGLSQRLADRARYNNEVTPFAAILASDGISDPPVVHIALAYRCPAEFEPSKAALSINDLRWIDAGNPSNALDDYDTTSQFLFLSGKLRSLVAAGVHQ
jgi:hypothetical protein